MGMQAQELDTPPGLDAPGDPLDHQGRSRLGSNPLARKLLDACRRPPLDGVHRAREGGGALRGGCVQQRVAHDEPLP